MGKVIDLKGQRFGRLLVLCRVDNDKFGKAVWRCLCDCGNTVCMRGTDIRDKRRNIKSCGCYIREKLIDIRTKHNESATRLFRIWSGMKDRTCNPNSKYFINYGKRGIDICEQWESSYIAFRDWALQNGYKDNLTIDRIDNDKGYYPNNCRWVGYKVQNNNSRNNHNILYNSQTKSLTEWAEEIGISPHTLSRRILVYGWSVEKALTTPIKKNK